MAQQNKHDEMNISEAVETLTAIAEFDLDREFIVKETEEATKVTKPKKTRQVEWLFQQNESNVIKIAKETFSIVLDYLHDFFKKQPSHISSHHAIERVKTIMVLVGEAAKNLDKYTSLFHDSQPHVVTALKEYQDLQSFYRSRISRRIDERLLSRWILALAEKEVAKPDKKLKLAIREKLASDHVFVDLESVKKDTEYELFFMRKANGSRFFSPKLIRNMKLVCDFEEYFGEQGMKDPLEGVRVWEDESVHAAARCLVQAIGTYFDQFYREAYKFQNREIVQILNKALTALMLSSYPHNLLAHAPVKSCSEYFHDFQHFLRRALNTREYQKCIAYPPKRSNRLAYLLLDIIHTLCESLFLYIKPSRDLVGEFNELVKDSNELLSEEHLQEVARSDQLWNLIACDYAAMQKMLRTHPNGPLVKVLEIIEGGIFQTFDPVWQHNLPFQFFSLFLNGQKKTNLHIPSPTCQEYINKAFVSDEFKGMLRSYKERQKSHLLVNFQDRTSWKEHARCLALEELQKHEDFKQQFTVLTLAKDTDFYNQLPPYETSNQAGQFIEQFKAHLRSETSGYFFPEKVRNQLFPKFLDELFEQVHHIFFKGKNVLRLQERKDFIELIYLFIELKAVDIVKPSSISLTCMDSVDRGTPAMVLFFTFLKILSGEKVAKEDRKFLNFLLYGTPILNRGRLIHVERIQRMFSALKTIEEAKAEMGTEEFIRKIQENFALYFKSDILEGYVEIPEILS